MNPKALPIDNGLMKAIQDVSIYGNQTKEALDKIFDLITPESAQYQDRVQNLEESESGRPIKGKTPLMLCFYGAPLYDVAEELLKNGADINAFCDFEPHHTAIHLAAVNSNERAVRFLLEREADVTHVFPKNNTSILHSCTFLSVEGVNLLIKAGAPITLVSKNFFTPLMRLCQSGNRAAESILMNGGQVHTYTRWGSPIMLARSRNPVLASRILCRAPSALFRLKRGFTDASLVKYTATVNGYIKGLKSIPSKELNQIFYAAAELGVFFSWQSNDSIFKGPSTSIVRPALDSISEYRSFNNPRTSAPSLLHLSGAAVLTKLIRQKAKELEKVKEQTPPAVKPKHRSSGYRQKKPVKPVVKKVTPITPFDYASLKKKIIEDPSKWLSSMFAELLDNYFICPQSYLGVYDLNIGGPICHRCAIEPLSFIEEEETQIIRPPMSMYTSNPYWDGEVERIMGVD